MSRLVVSPATRLDLLDIWNFLWSKNRKVANRIIGQISERFETLRAFPDSGIRRDELKTGLRSVPIRSTWSFT